jgi:Uma2 family endonuclease
MSMTLTPPLTSAEQKSSEHHWTAEEFYRAASAGEFADPDRLELVHGRLQRLMQGQRHANLGTRLSRRMRRALDPPLFAREEKPVHIGFDLELIPDIMFTYQEEYAERHPEPEDVALLVEIADSSMEYDLGEKALLYAQSGVADYWVVLAEAQEIVVYRQSSPEGYQEVARLVGTETLSPLALPEVAWTINELLGRTEASEEN